MFLQFIDVYFQPLFYISILNSLILIIITLGLSVFFIIIIVMESEKRKSIWVSLAISALILIFVLTGSLFYSISFEKKMHKDYFNNLETVNLELKGKLEISRNATNVREFQGDGNFIVVGASFFDRDGKLLNDFIYQEAELHCDKDATKRTFTGKIHKKDNPGFKWISKKTFEEGLYNLTVRVPADDQLCDGFYVVD